MSMNGISRRQFLIHSAAVTGAAAAAGMTPWNLARAQPAKARVGLLLPYTGTYAALGTNIRDALMLRVAENGGMLGGREVEYVDIDSEADPAKATDLTTKLIEKEKVDMLVGAVHSGVGMAMVKVAREAGTITVVANAGANALTGPMCAPNIFRSSFTSWQTGFPAGKAVLEDGHKRVALMYWNYGFGKETAAAFRESFEAGGGEIIKDIPTPFPEVEFQSYLTELASLKPDAVFVFYAGGGAVKFVKDYAAAGLKDKIPLYGSGFLTEGVTKAQGDAAEGLRTTLHYADSLDLPANARFRAAFNKVTGRNADVYAVQGYDAGDMLVQGMAAVQGDTGAREAMIAAMAGGECDSPRGRFRLSKAHHPIQDIYLREVAGGENRVLRVVQTAVEDPGAGCRMA